MSVSRLHYKARLAFIFFYDVSVIPLSWFGAYWLRFNLHPIPNSIFRVAIEVFPLLLLLQILMYGAFGLYRGVWRFASLCDVLRIMQSVGAGVLLFAMVLFFYSSLGHVPRSIYFLHPMLLCSFLGGGRFLYRFVKQKKALRYAQRVLVVGAGEAAETLVRDLLRQGDYLPVALVDDDRYKQGHEIHHVRVAGRCRDIKKVVKKYSVNLVFIALPSADSATMRRIVQYCEQSAVPFRTLPGLQDLVSGNVTVNALRDVSLEDLLGRDPVQLDWEKIEKNTRGKKVLVTGGAGSIGSELCRQIARLNPSELIVLDQNEFGLYRLGMALHAEYPDLNYTVALLDVTDEVGLGQLVAAHAPHIIFHAAAYKHVPMLEEQVCSAVSNNVLGTRVIAQAAIQNAVDIFVLISTDKAVNPCNVMGATKRVAEMLCQQLGATTSTRFMTVRFGNVLGSVGSVVPLFKEQIAKGGPVTVTHPDITRFFMTIPEAAQLILQASVLGSDGEIFVLDMGEPIRIRYLAEQMILFSGLKVDEDIRIAYTGLRPGEKLQEELFYESETLVQTTHKKILKAHSTINQAIFTHALVVMEDLIRKRDVLQLKRWLMNVAQGHACNSLQEEGV